MPPVSRAATAAGFAGRRSTRRTALLLPVITALVGSALAGPALADPALAAPPAAAAPAAPDPAPAVAPAPDPTPAPASPELLAAQSRATALRTDLDTLTLQTEQATETVNRLTEQLTHAAAERAAGAAELRQAQLAALAAAGALDDRARSIYKEGGTSSLYASMLDGESLHDVLRRAHSVKDVLASDEAASAAAQAATARAAAAEQHLAEVVATQARAQAGAESERNRVTGLLAHQEQLLASTDAAVLAMAEHERALADQASAQRFAAALAAAGGGAVPDATLAAAPGRPGGTPYAAAAVAAAMTELAKPYVWGATGPDSFDCSGLTQFAFARAGLALPRTAAEQWASGPQVALRELTVGDLLFWATNSTDPASIHHVAIYLGAGKMLAAPSTGDVVKIQPVYLDGFFGAVRPGAALGH
jgi:cell wall-associated NlpC family hydrolase